MTNLGTLLVCLAFFFAIPSILTLMTWIAFFLIYDKMATYEENDLSRILGADYGAYQQQVPKWLSRLIGARFNDGLSRLKRCLASRANNAFFVDWRAWGQRGSKAHSVCL
jgi:hypothetical protein